MENWLGKVMAQVSFVAPFYMISMAMCSYSKTNRLPWVDVKITLFTIDAFVCEANH